MKRYSLRTGISLCAAGVLLLGALPAAAITCRVAPERVPVSIGYHGAALTISGESAPGDDIVVQISTDPVDTPLKFKAKAAGIFWMKKGTLEFKGLPEVYQLFTTGELERILSPEERTRNRLGYEALTEKATVEDEGGAAAGRKWIKEFIKFKEDEDLYSLHEGAVVRHHGPEGNTYEVTVEWPFQATPRDYRVTALAVRDGTVAEEASATLTIASAGVVDALSRLAFNKSALYGIMAIVIAMAAGFAVGTIFKQSGSH